TIALFGAFSAGKSSFANALIGENILPSSPQPTTAVINRILPVSETNPHGTVLVQYKDEETLIQDIQDILSDYTPEADALDELIDWIKNNQLQHAPDLNDIYRSYLQAVVSGYQEAYSHFGKQISLSTAELNNYLTVESISCYLERVDIHYRCALTDQFITLVDTPGADSVNRRHTNVAFNYIKYADAIFYVTYYNHALSHADKAFLTQLGRVKDVFQLDKMFFIINAIDLAQDEADLNLVNHYVKDQLLELGIRYPAIFPLSSKNALSSKQEGTALQKGIRHFEEAFYTFIQQDLPALSIQSAFHDIRRVYQAVQTYLESIELNQEERNAKLQSIYKEQADFHDFIVHQDMDIMEKQCVQKVEKQIYYVEDRMKIGFHDMFKEAYNPASITESGKEGQEQLSRSLHVLLEDISFELVQEMQAVSLRVEAFMQTLLDDFYEGIDHYNESNSSSFLLPKRENTTFDTPDFERAFDELDSQMFRHVFAMYKGTRNFFVKNEKEAFKEKLFAVLEPLIHDYLMTQQTILLDAYQHQLTTAVNNIKSDLIKGMAQHVENNTAMLSDTMDKEQIINKKQELETILS
ncbi:MAG TPA: dynamin family protein, partial [Bacillota bacterium]|nr:dynamin family protein [Bacillota bacterium]